MGNEKTRENMIRAAEELRVFYESLSLSKETIERAVDADLRELPKEAPPLGKPAGS